MFEDQSPVLVTGGAGFIGSHLVRLLADQGRKVRVLDIAAPSEPPRPGVEFIRGDICRQADVTAAARDCPIILHLAANPNLWARHSAEFDAVNQEGTRHVLDAAARGSVHRVVHVSTESILTRAGDDAQIINEHTTTHLADMLGPYCRSKFRAEQSALSAAAAGLPVVIVSPTVPIGPGDHRLGPMSRLILDFARGRVRGYLPGTVNLIDVRDVAAGIWNAALHGTVGQRYLLAGENMQFEELFGLLAELTGRPAPRFRVPYSVALAFAWMEEQMCRWRPGCIPMATVTGVRLTRRSFRFDASASLAALGITPRPCRQALQETLDDFARRGLLPPRP